MDSCTAAFAWLSFSLGVMVSCIVETVNQIDGSAIATSDFSVVSYA